MWRVQHAAVCVCVCACVRACGGGGDGFLACRPFKEGSPSVRVVLRGGDDCLVQRIQFQAAAVGRRYKRDVQLSRAATPRRVIIQGNRIGSRDSWAQYCVWPLLQSRHCGHMLVRDGRCRKKSPRCCLAPHVMLGLPESYVRDQFILFIYTSSYLILCSRWAVRATS